MADTLQNIKDKVATKLHHGTSPSIGGQKVGPIGFGIMGMTWREEQTADEQCFAAMKAALAGGCNFWNGGLFYGTPESNSLHLLDRYFRKYPEDASKVVLSIKAGLPDMKTGKADGSKANVDKEINECLRILDPSVKKIDLYQMCRVDKDTPIAETVSFIQEHVKAGRIGGIGLSEAGAETIRKAAKAGTIAAVEIELSLFFTDVMENGVLKACADNNIPVVAYSPLGKGFLTGAYRKLSDIPKGDPRLHSPRFSEQYFDKNVELADEVAKIAKEKGCTPGQLALAWVVTIGDQPGQPTIIPIPGATRAERVEENAGAAKIKLSREELDKLDSLLKQMPVSGDRNPEALERLAFA